MTCARCELRGVHRVLRQDQVSVLDITLFEALELRAEDVVGVWHEDSEVGQIFGSVHLCAAAPVHGRGKGLWRPHLDVDAAAKRS